jgi:predicted acylesterase/phospholipase RssA
VSVEAPHVTLVLGAGGPVGKAFHAGVLRALAERCGWDPRAATVIVGTSAGAHIGALLRVGMPAHLLEQALGEPLPTDHWPHRPLWIPALRLGRGGRVVFGREDAPRVDVATAVRCSSAVPGVRPPVAVGEARYIDGGVASPTHADLALHAAPEAQRHTVVVLSPLSRFLPLRWLLRWELRPVRRRGIDVVLFEPDRAIARAMGWNPMDARRAPAVAAVAYGATMGRLASDAVASAVRQLVGM